MPNSAVPDAWLDDIWMTHGVYLETERRNGAEDTITSMVRLLALLTWPTHERRPRKGKLRLNHTDMEYPVRDLAGAWNDFMVPTDRFERVKSCQVATMVRTGRWPPARILDA